MLSPIPGTMAIWRIRSAGYGKLVAENYIAAQTQHHNATIHRKHTLHRLLGIDGKYLILPP